MFHLRVAEWSTHLVATQVFAGSIPVSQSMAYKDINKQRAAQKRWYEDNKDRCYQHSLKYKASKSEFIKQIKSVPCADCGIQYPHYVMQFDHVRGKKEFNLANATNRGWERIKLEIEKCDIVCANCHFERTWQRKSSLLSLTE